MNKSYMLQDDTIKVKEEQRLFDQAEGLFEIEFNGFDFATFFGTSKRLVDLGAGNGAYLSCFARYQPALQLIGVDRNKFLIEQGAKRSGAVAFIERDIFEFIRDTSLEVDTVFLLRFVLQHLDNDFCEKFVSLLIKNHSGKKLIVIDVDDSKVECGDPLLKSLHNNLIEKQHSRGGNRNIAQTIAKVFQRNGAKILSEKEIRYDSKILGREKMNEIFLELLLINSKTVLMNEDRSKLADQLSFYSKLFLIQL